LNDPCLELLIDLIGTQSGAVVHRQGSPDPVQATRRLLATHHDARFVKSTRHLILPPISEHSLKHLKSAAALGQAIIKETGVSWVTVSHESGGFVFRGHINPVTPEAWAKMLPWVQQVVERFGKYTLYSIVREVGTKTIQRVVEEFGGDALCGVIETGLIELLAPSSRCSMGSVVWLSKRDVSKEAWLILKKKVFANTLDLDWLSTTTLSDFELDFLAVDPGTKWNLFRDVATRPISVTPSIFLAIALRGQQLLRQISDIAEPMERVNEIAIEERRKKGKDSKDLEMSLRGISGEMITFAQRAEIAPEIDVNERQAVMGGSRLTSRLDFKGTHQVSAKSLAIEVKTQRGVTWRADLDGAIAHATSLVQYFNDFSNPNITPQTDAPDSILRLLKQLRNALSHTDLDPILVVSDDIAADDVSRLQSLVFDVLGHGLNISFIEETHIGEVRKGLKESMGLNPPPK
jgi:hypothetical protein